MAPSRFWPCSIISCPTKAKRGFYRIPENSTGRDAWIKACKFPSDIKKTAAVCWKHFKKSDFQSEMDEKDVNELGMGRLKQNVVPSLLLPEFLEFEPDSELSIIQVEVVTEISVPPCHSDNSDNSDSECEMELIVHDQNSTDHDYFKKGIDPKDRRKKDLASSQTHVRLLKKRNTLLQNKNSALMSGNLPKTVQDKVVKNVLCDKGELFTPKQCQLMCKPRRTEGQRTKKGHLIIKAKDYPNADFCKAMRARIKMGRRGYICYRNEMEIKTHGITTLDQKFR